MIVDTPGLVLRYTKYSDTSLIVKIYTEAKGTVGFMVKNAFGRKSAVRASLFAPLARVNVIYNDLPNKNLHYIKEVSRLDNAANMAFDPAKNALLMFYSELLYKLLWDAAEDRVLFRFLNGEVQTVENGGADWTDLPLRFLLRLSAVLGFEPENNYSARNCHFSLLESRFQPQCLDISTELPETESCYLSQLLCDDPSRHATRQTRNCLLHYLIDYYKLHNEQIRDIDSIDILSEILH